MPDVSAHMCSVHSTKVLSQLSSDGIGRTFIHTSERSNVYIFDAFVPECRNAAKHVNESIFIQIRAVQQVIVYALLRDLIKGKIHSTRFHKSVP